MPNWKLLKKQHDPDNYYEALINFPEHIKKAINQMRTIRIPDFNFNKVLICGMGGSAIPGHLLKDYCYQNCKTLIEVESSYHLPEWADEKTLIILISYSGNTEETLSCFHEALKVTKNVITISSGGLLEKASRKHKIMNINAPKNFQPRAATPYLFTYVLKILEHKGIIKALMNEAVKELKILKEELKIENESPAKKIAIELMNKYIYIYVQREFESIGIRYQAQDFNENAKMLAKYSVIPEANHNETTGISDCQSIPLIFLFLRDYYETASIKERMDFSERIAKQKGKVIRIKPKGKTLLSRMLSFIYQGDMISYYLSLLRGINPLPVPLVEELKKVLERKTNNKKMIIRRLGVQK